MLRSTLNFELPTYFSGGRNPPDAGQRVALYLHLTLPVVRSFLVEILGKSCHLSTTLSEKCISLKPNIGDIPLKRVQQFVPKICRQPVDMVPEGPASFTARRRHV
jgi:hypothetical protein